jgi:hypothetical protein
MTVKHLLEQKGQNLWTIDPMPQYSMHWQKWLKKTSVL